MIIAKKNPRKSLTSSLFFEDFWYWRLLDLLINSTVYHPGIKVAETDKLNIDSIIARLLEGKKLKTKLSSRNLTNIFILSLKIVWLTLEIHEFCFFYSFKHFLNLFKFFLFKLNFEKLVQTNCTVFQWFETFLTSFMDTFYARKVIICLHIFPTFLFLLFRFFPKKVNVKFFSSN